MSTPQTPISPLTLARKETVKDKEKENPKPNGKLALGKLALVLIRGLVGIRKDIKSTLFVLKLRKKHACVIIEDTPSNRALTLKCKDYVAYGEVDDETLKLLLSKRGRKNPSKEGVLKNYFLLHPPKGGFERKGIKIPFTKGGALGYRGSKINDLIKKMI